MGLEEKIGTGWADLFKGVTLTDSGLVELMVDASPTSPTYDRLVPVLGGLHLGYSQDVTLSPTIQKQAQKPSGSFAPVKSKLTSTELNLTCQLVFNRDPDVEALFRLPGNDNQYSFTIGSGGELPESNLLIIEYNEHLPDIVRCIVLYRGEYQPAPFYIGRVPKAIPCKFEVFRGYKTPVDPDCPFKPTGSDLGFGWWVYRLSANTLYNPRTKQSVNTTPSPSKHIPIYPTPLVLSI
ncbi:MAG: hypothetical protein WAQ98_11035 [Blastocatellia bacterium]